MLSYFGTGCKSLSTSLPTKVGNTMRCNTSVKVFIKGEQKNDLRKNITKKERETTLNKDGNNC